jgi:hypothetical protein
MDFHDMCLVPGLINYDVYLYKRDCDRLSLHYVYCKWTLHCRPSRNQLCWCNVMLAVHSLGRLRYE